MNTLYVRVAPKSGNTQFYRCAMLFTLAWSLVVVDEATKMRLLAEQMLEVSETKPEGYVEADTQAENYASGESTAAADAIAEQADAEPAEPAEAAAPAAPAEPVAPAPEVKPAAKPKKGTK